MTTKNNKKTAAKAVTSAKVDNTKQQVTSSKKGAKQGGVKPVIESIIAEPTIMADVKDGAPEMDSAVESVGQISETTPELNVIAENITATDNGVEQTEEPAIVPEITSLDVSGDEHSAIVLSDTIEFDTKPTDVTESLEQKGLTADNIELTIVGKTEISIAETTKKAGKPKRKDITYVAFVGCSYHYFRKFLKKLYNNKAIPVRFVRPEVGYNGHIEVSEAEKDSALAAINTFQTEHPDIKNLYWELAK